MPSNPPTPSPPSTQTVSQLKRRKPSPDPSTTNSTDRRKRQHTTLASAAPPADPTQPAPQSSSPPSEFIKHLPPPCLIRYLARHQQLARPATWTPAEHYQRFALLAPPAADGATVFATPPPPARDFDHRLAAHAQAHHHALRPQRASEPRAGERPEHAPASPTARRHGFDSLHPTSARDGLQAIEDHVLANFIYSIKTRGSALRPFDR